MVRFAMLLVLLPMLAQAMPSARFFPDALPGAGGGDAGPACACEQQKGIGFGELFGKTAVVGVASSAGGVVLGAGLGLLSNNLIGAAIPGLLIANLIVPPLLTALAAHVIGNWDTPDRFGFWLPLAGAFVVNLGAVLVTTLAMNIAVGITNPFSLMAFAVVDGLLMSGATTGLMALTEKKKVTTVQSFVPGVTPTTLVVLQEVAF